jgi:hypothetical protein
MRCASVTASWMRIPTATRNRLGDGAGSRTRQPSEVCVTGSVTIGSERDAQVTTRRTWIARRYLVKGAEFRTKIAILANRLIRFSRPPPSTTRPSLRVATRKVRVFSTSLARVLSV